MGCPSLFAFGPRPALRNGARIQLSHVSVEIAELFHLGRDPNARSPGPGPGKQDAVLKQQNIKISNGLGTNKKL